MNESKLIKNIKEKSKKSGIEFPNLLMHYIRCEVYKILSGNSVGEKIVFLNEPILRTGIFQKKDDMSVKVFVSPELKDGDLLHELGDSLSENGIILKKIKKIKSGFELELSIGRYSTDMILEFVRIQDDKVYPVRKDIVCKADESIKFEILLYPIECQAIDLISEIIKKLELINDMDVYYRLNQILEEEPLDGLKLSKEMEKRIESGEIKITPEKMKKLISYSKYKYMKNKWDRYQRVNNRKEPTWEKQQETLMKFLTPLWDSMSKGNIFIDNWMPELGRYLG